MSWVGSRFYRDDQPDKINLSKLPYVVSSAVQSSSRSTLCPSLSYSLIVSNSRADSMTSTPLGRITGLTFYTRNFDDKRQGSLRDRECGYKLIRTMKIAPTTAPPVGNRAAISHLSQAPNNEMTWRWLSMRFISVCLSFVISAYAVSDLTSLSDNRFGEDSVISEERSTSVPGPRGLPVSEEPEISLTESLTHSALPVFFKTNHAYPIPSEQNKGRHVHDRLYRPPRTNTALQTPNL